MTQFRRVFDPGVLNNYSYHLVIIIDKQIHIEVIKLILYMHRLVMVIAIYARLGIVLLLLGSDVGPERDRRIYPYID